MSICNRRLYAIKVLKGLLSHEDLWIVFNATIQSILLYSTTLFGMFDSEIQYLITRIFKRTRKTICNDHCNCDNTVSKYYRLRLNAFQSLFHKSQNVHHPLFAIVPHVFNNHVTVASCRTARRQNCFTVLSTIIFNGLTDLTSTILS